MERGIILWDDDIGWCERLRRALEKSDVAIEEAEGWEELWQRLTEYVEDKEVSHKVQEDTMSGRREILAVVLSGQKLFEEQPEEWQTLLQEICKIGAAPVFYVGEGEDEEQELQAFLLGVSDYIERAKDIRICAARIFACAGRWNLHQSKDSIDMGLVLDERTRRFYCGNAVQDLTQKECLVLSRLLKGGGNVVARKDLLSAAWGTDAFGKDRVLDTVIKQLRHKLRPASYSIQSKYGVGYAVKRNLSKNA